MKHTAQRGVVALLLVSMVSGLSAPALAGGLRPPDPLTRSLAGTPNAPLRSRGSFATLTRAEAYSFTSSQGAPAADADLKEVANYKLTMATVEKVKVATRAMIAEIMKDPKYQQLMKVEAEIEALEKKQERTEAEDEKLAALNEQKEKLETAADSPLSLGQANSLSEMEANIRKSPPIANALQSAGMSPREYATFMMAMIQASMVAGFKKAGMMKELPKDVNPENVKFIEEHEAELKAMQAEFEKLAKGGN